MFLKQFNIMMVGDLIISSLGVLPAALTPGEVKVGNRVLNGRYQQKLEKRMFINTKRG
ncbi:Uncharacterised protein [Weissella viridescens]|uniref:Uncharacterized protein n=1 Tax=Weissella viridescens TaxID=1629 RepID=A0A380NY64_WEIVI|nr:Uncharacterised protein [Weissella viridescens]